MCGMEAVGGALFSMPLAGLHLVADAVFFHQLWRLRRQLAQFIGVTSAHCHRFFSLQALVLKAWEMFLYSVHLIIYHILFSLLFYFRNSSWMYDLLDDLPYFLCFLYFLFLSFKNLLLSMNFSQIYILTLQLNLSFQQSCY